jgi:Transcriptional regulator PadR-like family
VNSYGYELMERLATDFEFERINAGTLYRTLRQNPPELTHKDATGCMWVSEKPVCRKLGFREYLFF